MAMLIAGAAILAACQAGMGPEPRSPAEGMAQDRAATGAMRAATYPAPAPAMLPVPQQQPAQTTPPPPAATVPVSPAEAARPGNPRTGLRFALDNCQPCHVVAKKQASEARFANAPDFRAIANMPQTTTAGLYVWLTNPHPTMPTLHLTQAEAANVIAYIVSLHRK